MLITENFIEMIMHEYTLNKAQFKILGQSFPPIPGWESLVLDNEITDIDSNLLILLKGKFALTAQKKIIDNYKTMISYNNQEKLTMPIEIINDNKFEDILTIYCDGACSNNPGNSGSGLALYYGNDSPVLLYGDFDEYGTNNTAELKALYKALIIASEANNENKIVIFSDSQYSIDCITKWAYSWKIKNWTKKGGEIKNLELIQVSHLLFDKIKKNIEIRHVKGHSGIEGNELADRMAVHAIASTNINYEEYNYDNIEEVL
jgi:ribonuclease HI